MSKKNVKTDEELLQDALVPVEDQPYEIPRHWKWVRLGDCCEVKRGASPRPKGDPRYFGGEFGWLKISDLSAQGKYIYNTEDSVTQLGKEKSVWVDPDTIILSISASVGKVCITKVGLCIHDGFVKLVENQKLLDKEFLYLTLINSLNQMLAKAKGATQININSEIVKNLVIPLPPLDEQKRIANKIEKLSDKINQSKQLIEEAKQTFELRRAAILEKAFSGELTSKRGIYRTQTYELRDVIEGLNQGWSPKCESFPSLDRNIWGVIKTTAIQAMNFVEKENKQLPSHLLPKVQHELKEGDILITRAGPRPRVGICCLVPTIRPKLLLCDKAYRFRADINKVLPKYLAYYLNTPEKLTLINEMKTGISESGLNLTQDKILSLKIDIPTLDIQQKVVNLIDNLFERELIVNDALNLLTPIETITNSILSKAFRGDI